MSPIGFVAQLQRYACSRLAECAVGTAQSSSPALEVATGVILVSAPIDRRACPIDCFAQSNEYFHRLIRCHMADNGKLLKITTSHGSIVVEDSGGPGIPLLMIHGNSSCREVFGRQVQDPAFAHRRTIALDLPGHGGSADADDPDRSYTRQGLTDLVVEVLSMLDVREAVVLGWSLGGHVGIQMLSRFPRVVGLIITGTPPVSRGGLGQPLGRALPPPSGRWACRVLAFAAPFQPACGALPERHRRLSGRRSTAVMSVAYLASAASSRARSRKARRAAEGLRRPG
jgi:pimeloyl-ACP methyl ester carboxylesterase